MKKQVVYVVALLAICLVAAGCGDKAESQQIVLTNGQASGQAEIPAVSQTEQQTVSQPAAAAPAEDFSKTPESLDNTAWVLKDESDTSARVALFFRNGMVTIITQSYHYEDAYRYKNSILETDPINIGFEGEVDGARLVVTYYGNPHPDLTRVSIADAILYAQEIDPGCATPFDSNYPGIDFDTGDSGIMNGSNAGAQNAGQNGKRDSDGLYVWYIGSTELKTRTNIQAYIDGSSWDMRSMMRDLGLDRSADTYFIKGADVTWRIAFEGKSTYSGVCDVGFWTWETESKADYVLYYITDYNAPSGTTFYVNGADRNPVSFEFIVAVTYSSEHLLEDPYTDAVAGVLPLRKSSPTAYQLGY